MAAIVESSEDAILSMNLDGVVTSWNTRAEKMFGYYSKEIIGKSIHYIYPTNKTSELEEICRSYRKMEQFREWWSGLKELEVDLESVLMSEDRNSN